ncbi:MAG: DUF6285 domain-containing protein [Betaproteobacteria bacterium]
MKNISDATDLIATAREALLEELLPRIPKEQRYAGLMIANAMAIALREQRCDAQVTRDELARLRALLPATAPHSEATKQEALLALRRKLCTAIRAGAFDEGARRHELEAHLARTAADWVAISNPKALRAPQAAA